MSGRKIADCRLMPSDENCTLMISGSEEEVMKVAVRHAVMEHGHEDNEETRNAVRATLKDE